MAEDNKEVEKEMMSDFSDKIKAELREIGLVKQEEKIKVTKNTKGYNYEFTLLGKPEDNYERVENVKDELNRRLG